MLISRDDLMLQRRLTMVERQLRARGISDPRVLAAMQTLPRHLFVPPEGRDRAYDDSALPIGWGQTISQPYMVALMLQALELRGTERVLDIGTGSGYQAALLGMLAERVHSVEIVPELVEQSRGVIEGLGLDNVHVSLGDGSTGLISHAPFDAIVVAAGAPEVPSDLLDQLSSTGTLVIPVGGLSGQELRRIRRVEGDLRQDTLTPCIFVPLVGERAWPRRLGAVAGPFA